MLMTCLERDTEYGIIIMARIIEDVSIPTPYGKTCSFNSRFLIMGTRTTIPQKPYTTDGMLAKNLKIFLKIFYTIPTGKLSPKKIAVDMANGMEKKGAKKEVK